MLQSTHGRYQPPSRETDMDTLLSMRAKSDNELARDSKTLLADERISPSISGNILSGSCDTLLPLMMMYMRLLMPAHPLLTF